MSSIIDEQFEDDFNKALEKFQVEDVSEVYRLSKMGGANDRIQQVVEQSQYANNESPQGFFINLINGWTVFSIYTISIFIGGYIVGKYVQKNPLTLFYITYQSIKNSMNKMMFKQIKTAQKVITLKNWQFQPSAYGIFNIISDAFKKQGMGMLQSIDGQIDIITKITNPQSQRPIRLQIAKKFILGMIDEIQKLVSVQKQLGIPLQQQYQGIEIKLPQQNGGVVQLSKDVITKVINEMIQQQISTQQQQHNPIFHQL